MQLPVRCRANPGFPFSTVTNPKTNSRIWTFIFWKKLNQQIKSSESFDPEYLRDLTSQPKVWCSPSGCGGFQGWRTSAWTSWCVWLLNRRCLSIWAAAHTCLFSDAFNQIKCFHTLFGFGILWKNAQRQVLPWFLFKESFKKSTSFDWDGVPHYHKADNIVLARQIPWHLQF